ncbi:TonB-dependent receptor [Flavobacterium soli]|uniref:TonB-dependent receptor n=1 Tax=Flavobacterium soli TaxID=344881 RepID=UPI0004080D1F|nr:TonB-dependent receptor [Flavobacterium soli]
MKFKFLLITLFICVASFSQNKGTVSGTITDKDLNDEVLPFANVMIKGTTIGMSTDMDGKYSLNVAAGNHILQISFVGYESVEVPFTVKANETTTVNQSIGSGSVKLEDIVITNNVNRQKEASLLIEQKNAVEIKQNIGAQELSRKGVGDVASAVAKTSGISKQEGSNNVFVRGLGDRYNSTSINGLPIPSNDPEKKNIALDLFSTDIVEYISIDKVYNVRNFGDFAGGNVDITSKDYKGKGMFEISLGSKINSNAIDKQNDFLLQRGPRTTGFVSYGVPKDPLTSFSFENSLTPTKEAPFGGNISLKAGESFEIGEEGKLNLFATASFDSGFEQREGLNQSLNAQGATLKSFQQERFSYKTNTTGMFNANYRINSDHKIGYNFLFVNSSDQSRDTYFGEDRDFDNSEADLLVQRATFIQNTIMINQLLGNHKLTDKLGLDWGASFNTVKGDMPDRTQNKMFYTRDTQAYTLVQRTVTDNHRYFQNLTEDELAANLSLTYKLGDNENGDSKGKITAGYNGRFKKRDFEAIQFNFGLTQEAQQIAVDPNGLDVIFNQQNYGDLFTTSSFAGMTPQTYSGEQNIHAGFANLEYKLSQKLSGVFGVRYEKVEQSVEWRTQLDGDGGTNTFDRNEFLPSLILKYELNEKQNLRFAASKTYTLPQFKERAPFLYEDITEVKFGNPYLYPSQDYNLDLKWEMFPKAEELISVTVFGKYIVDPINEITLASSTNDISWVNIGDQGYVLGAEFEIRKNIFKIDSELTNKLSAGLNASYMKTHQDIDSEKVRLDTEGTLNVNITDTESSFTGASDLILNADLSYARNWSTDAGFIATVAYSHYSDRLYALGVEQKGNLVDKGMGTLDFIFKTKITKNLGIDLAARNILNPEFKRVQENATETLPAVSYKRGVVFGLGINYQF